MRSSLVLPLAALMVAAAVLGSAALRAGGPASERSARAPVDPPVVMVRSGRAVTPDWAERADAVPGVDEVVLVRRGQALLRGSADERGRVLQSVRRGYALPVDTLVAAPAAYAAMLPRPARDAVARLRPGEAVLSETAALVRGVDRGATLTFDRGAARVAAVVDDPALLGAEMLIARPEAGVQIRAGLLLARVVAPAVRELLAREFAGEAGQAIWRGYPYGTPRAPIVQPQEIKARFGEVAVRLPFGRDWVRLDPGWVRRNVVKQRVPILGRVRCNRMLIAPLRQALGELQRRGLSRLVDRRDFAGCFAPRRIPSTGALSFHARGLAVDLNARRNPEGRPSRQDPRLVEVMERHGFTWGGAWPTVPDAMHFEWQEVRR